MEWAPWVVLVVGIVATVVVAPRLYRRERGRQRERGTIPGGFGVVDEAWRPAEHAARLERERREEAHDESQAPGEPDRLADDVPAELRDDDDLPGDRPRRGGR